MSLHSIIQRKPSLAWYVKDPTSLSDASVVEHVLQYGNWADVQDLFKEKSISEVATLFSQTVQTSRSNYSPAIEHFFRLYFAKHAS